MWISFSDPKRVIPAQNWTSRHNQWLTQQMQVKYMVITETPLDLVAFTSICIEVLYCKRNHSMTIVVKVRSVLTTAEKIC